MKAEEIFKQTPFGGYKKEDVLDYLRKTDEKQKEERKLLQTQLREKEAENREQAEKILSLNRELQIKTELASEAETEKQAKTQAEKRVEELQREKEELTEKCRHLTDELAEREEANRNGYSCSYRNGAVCTAISEEARKLLADAKEEAEKVISSAKEQAAGIILNARIEAQAMITESERQTDTVARQISDQAHEIIEMTVTEAKQIISDAKQQGDGILASSAQSIGKIKGNLSSMQMVVKSIENELRNAKESLTGTAKKEG